jgi:hypothetical protein
MENLLNTTGDGAGKPDLTALGTDKGGDVFDDYDTVFQVNTVGYLAVFHAAFA